MANHQRTTSFSTAQISQDLLDQINTLDQKIGYFDKKLQKSSADDPEHATLKNQVFELKLEYEKIIRILENEYPEYYELKYASSDVNSAEVFKRLGNNTALIEYFYTDEDLYIFTLSNGTINGTKRPLTFDLKTTIHQLRNYGVENMALQQQSRQSTSKRSVIYTLL